MTTGALYGWVVVLGLVGALVVQVVVLLRRTDARARRERVRQVLLPGLGVAVVLILLGVAGWLGPDLV